MLYQGYIFLVMLGVPVAFMLAFLVVALVTEIRNRRVA